MTTEKTNDEIRMLIGIHATGLEPKTLEEIEETCGPIISLLYPDGRWEAYFTRLVKEEIGFYDFFESKDQTGLLFMPGAASFRVSCLGPVREEWLEEAQQRACDFGYVFLKKVLEPLLDYWFAYAISLGLPVSEKEWDEASKYVLLYTDGFLGGKLIDVACTPWGRRQIEEGGWRALWRKHIETVRKFIVNDVRVNFGNAELAEAIELRYNELVEENLLELLASDVE